jgi:hypothetical protein
MQREDGPFVSRLPREIGKRELRYAHLFSGDVQTEHISESVTSLANLSSSDRERLDDLENQVSELRQDMEQIKLKLDRLTATKTPENTET